MSSDHESPVMGFEAATEAARRDLPPTHAPSIGLRLIVAVVLLGVGVILALATGLGAVAASAVKNDAGFYEVTTERWQTDARVFIAGSGEQLVDTSGLLEDEIIGRLNASVEAESDRPIFVGIATRSDAAAYAADLEPPTPAEAGIWIEASHGPGSRSVTWQPHKDLALVLMNEDGAPGVDVEAAISAELPWVRSLIYGAMAVSGVLLVAGSALLLRALRSR